MQQCFSWVCDLLDLLQRTGTVDWFTASDLSKRSQGQFPCSISKLKLKSTTFSSLSSEETDQICITTSLCYVKPHKKEKKSRNMDVGSYLLYVADRGGEADLDRFLINFKSCNSLTLTLKYWSEGDNEIAFSNKWAY